ncbi:Tetratricopeptide-like helical [Corchorus olitorius]|uniref:Tetratricopeptide-like helical n=1 Tax=Corchorus olitorius TaxID=93759 RepID=A0A1R3HSE8_9ROSI|nr:Tetratricopeptide-like helical [Corchorus olitorius]
MSVSMEALAMAGIDCVEWGMDIEEWEEDDDLNFPPAHLLADDIGVEEITAGNHKFHCAKLNAAGVAQRHFPKKEKKKKQLKGMSVSIEALAMAGTDYVEWGMEIEEWENGELLEPPPHLLAEETQEEKNHVKGSSSSIYHFIINLLSHIMVILNDVANIRLFEAGDSDDGEGEEKENSDHQQVRIVNFKFKDLNAVVEDLSSCVKVDTNNKSAYTYLFYQDLANSKKALECLEKGLQIDGRYAKAYHLRGLLIHGMGENSSNIECLYLRASCYHVIGEYTEAVTMNFTVKDCDAALDVELDSMGKFVVQCIAIYQVCSSAE